MLLGMKKYTFTPSLVQFCSQLWILAFSTLYIPLVFAAKSLSPQLWRKFPQTWNKCVFFHSKQHSKLAFWVLRPLKTAFGIKTDFCDKNQVKSQNPVVAKFQKWPRMLRIDPLEGLRGLVSFANFLTPVGASRQVCMRLLFISALGCSKCKA